MSDPFRTVDDDARNLARSLLTGAQHAALGVLDPESQAPMVTRIALAAAPMGLLTLISDLSTHTTALRANPDVSLLVGEPGPKGDPLTHPRLTIQARASFVAQRSPQHAEARAAFLKHQPKARLYADFADFHFVRFTPQSALLNGGFGKAYRLAPTDLALG